MGGRRGGERDGEKKGPERGRGGRGGFWRSMGEVELSLRRRLGERRRQEAVLVMGRWMDGGVEERGEGRR